MPIISLDSTRFHRRVGLSTLRSPSGVDATTHGDGRLFLTRNASQKNRKCPVHNSSVLRYVRSRGGSPVSCVKCVFCRGSFSASSRGLRQLHAPRWRYYRQSSCSTLPGALVCSALGLFWGAVVYELRFHIALITRQEDAISHIYISTCTRSIYL